jgi:hypothetical protein
MAVSGVVQSFQRQVHPLAEWQVVAGLRQCDAKLIAG